jgi:DNA modification methylase
MHREPLASNGITASSRIRIEHRLIADLMLDPQNPRCHSRKQVRQIARSIETFGFNVPVLVDGAGKVIAGHGRLLACQELGWDEIPTIALAHLTEAQAKAFMIADNRLTEIATWDDRLLAEQLRDLSIENLDFDLEVIGFDMGEIDLRIEGLEPEAAEADAADEIPEPLEEVVTRPGEIWQLGTHRLLCGNALEEAAYEQLLDGRKAGVVFIDPPFNVRIDGHAGGLGKIHHREFAMASGEMSEAEFTAFLTQALGLLARHAEDGSIHFVCIDWRHVGELLAAGKAAYTELKNLCVWTKDNAGMGSLYRSQHELVLVFKNGTAPHQNHVQLGQFGRTRSNVWRYPGVNSFGRNTEEGNLLALHPTVKPVALVADALKDCSSRGEVVLDTFLGSGTTLLAAERTGRICYGLEIDPRYVDTAIRRWQAATGQKATLAGSDQTFDALQAERGAASPPPPPPTGQGRKEGRRAKQKA